MIGWATHQCIETALINIIEGLQNHCLVPMTQETLECIECIFLFFFSTKNDQCFCATKNIFCHILGLLRRLFGLGKFQMVLKQPTKLWYQDEWIDYIQKYKWVLTFNFSRSQWARLRGSIAGRHDNNWIEDNGDRWWCWRCSSKVDCSRCVLVINCFSTVYILSTVQENESSIVLIQASL